jgi:hypothetical protein
MPFEPPEPWLSRLHPRRGGAGVRPVEPDPRAREVVDGHMELEPGIVHGAVDLFPEQTLGPIRFRRRTATLGDLDPVVISEVIRDLEALTGGR